MHRLKWIVAPAVFTLAALLVLTFWPNNNTPRDFHAGALVTLCGDVTGEIASPPPGRTGTFKDDYSPFVLTLRIEFSSQRELILAAHYPLTRVEGRGDSTMHDDETVRVSMTAVQQAIERCKEAS
jgi:hypothetical protein